MRRAAWRPRRRMLQAVAAGLLLLSLAALVHDLRALHERQAWNARIAAAAHALPPALVAGAGAATSPVAASSVATSPSITAAVPTAASGSASAAAASAPPVADATPGAWRMVEALAMARAGRDDEALARLAALQADPDLAGRARFNAGNILLRRALALRDGPAPGLALPALEGAKAAYRDVLRRDPEDWDARYNLDRALHLAPDAGADEEPAAMRVGAERAATTMRGVSPGLP